MRGVTPTPRGRWRLQAHQRQSRKARIKRTARWYCFIFNTSLFGKIRPRDTPKYWCTPLYVQLARLAEVKQRSQRLLLDDLNTPLPPRQQEDFETLKQVKPFITVSDDERRQPEPPVLGSPLPELPTTKKKKRRQNKAKARATVNQAAPLNNTILKDLHESNLFTTHYNDGLINDDSMFSETDRLSLTRPSLSSQVALVPVPGPAQALDLNLDPHLHPLLTFSHILSLPHHPSPPTLPLFSPTPSPLSLHPHPFPSQFSSSCLNPHVHVYDLDEIDDDECGDDYIYY